MLDDLAAALTRLAADLTALRVEFAIVGGLAVSRRAEPRMTRDVDVVIAAAPGEADKVARGLFGRGYRQREDGFLVRRNTDRLATLRLDSPAGVVVDLLIERSGIEGEIVEVAETLTVLENLRLPFARTGHLIALKILANRARDSADLEALFRVALPEDINLARTAVDLIVRRGFAEERDLQTELEVRLAHLPGPNG